MSFTCDILLLKKYLTLNLVIYLMLTINKNLKNNFLCVSGKHAGDLYLYKVNENIKAKLYTVAGRHM